MSIFKENSNPDLSLVGYNIEDNSFSWNGSFNQLKDLLEDILWLNDKYEVCDDRAHNALSLKMDELTVRFYETTKTLKFYGRIGRLLIDKLHVKLNTFPAEPNSTVDLSSLSEPPLQSHQQNISSTEHPAIIQTVLEKIEILAKEVAELKASNKFSNSEENEEIKNLKEEINIQNELIANLQKEKDALIKTITILMRNNVNCSANQSEVEINSSQVNNSTEATKTNTKKKKKKKKSNKNDVTEQPLDTKSTTTQRHQVQHSKPPMNSQPQKQSTNTNETNHHSQRQNNSRQSCTDHEVKTHTIIVGDSIVSKLEGWRMSNKTNKVTVKAFSGATVDDMSDYIKPLVRRYKPDRVILQVGTNNLKNDQPQSIVDKLKNVVEYIKNNSGCEVTVCELTCRGDSLESKRKDLNRLIQSSFDKTITHNNINRNHLNTKGLHLNQIGVSLLATNLNNYIRNNIIVNDN